MASWAVVEDGKIVESTSQSSLKKASDASKNGMDKDAFLQLLVAQMKYQDPLEPTSNMHSSRRWSRCRIWQLPRNWQERPLWWVKKCILKP